jgi:hypothetical protein
MRDARGKIAIATALLFIILGIPQTRAQRNQSNQTIATEEDFRRAMQDVSNWDRWGKDDELGAANLITPAKRKQAAALVKEGVAISMAHNIFQEEVPDGYGHLERTLARVRPTGTSDKYAFTSTYHGSTISHLDAINCHVMVDGKGYNGRSMEDVETANGCPQGGITALKDGIVTRAVLFDATKLPGKATKGWLEPGTPVHRADLETLEKLEHVKVTDGDVILLYTGRWKRREALGPWKTSEGVAGYHADVVYFLRNVVFPSSAKTNGMMFHRPGYRHRSGSRSTRWRWSRWASTFSTTSISSASSKLPGD